MKDAADADKALAKLDADPPEEAPGFARAARDLKDAGRYDEARAVLERGLVAFPDDADLFKGLIDVATELSDVDAASAALSRWEEADSRGTSEIEASAARRARDLAEQRAHVDQATALSALMLASGLFRVQQYVEAGDAYRALAREFPDYESMTAASALLAAGSAYRSGWAIDEARAAYQEVVDRYPESDEAGTARSLLSTLPR